MTTEHQPAPTFRELLRRSRLAAGLTQEELAEKSGLSARGISDLERGLRGYPHPDTVRRLAAAFGLDGNAYAAFLQAAPRLTGRSREAPDAERRCFPTPLTPLVGREEEAATVCRWFQEDGRRLVTLSGPGGMGKTRLALAVAKRMAGAFRDGQVFVDLAPLRDPALLMAQIAAALGLQEHPGQALQETLTAFLRPRHMLIVLDNFEQLLPSAPAITDLLQAAPDLSMLVTSRAPLRLQGERLFRVPSLGGDIAGTNDLAAARANDAVTLFVARVQAIQADFDLTVGNAATVLTICRRLEGAPLALELAAARTSVLPLATLRDRLTTSLPLLTSGTRDAPPRHRTLRDAIAWSDDLLEPQVRAFFHRLGIFEGGWTLEAAEAVAAPDGDLDVVEGLAALGDLSLIRVVDGGAEPRYMMLETIREFARERLAASPEAERIEQAHAAYFSAFAASGAQHLTGNTQGEWLRRLDAEIPNLRAALQTLAQAIDSDGYLRMSANLGDYWFRRSYFTEGQQHLETALARAPESSHARASALLWLGALSFGQADFDTAAIWLQQCESLARARGALSLMYDALFWRAVVSELQGDEGGTSTLFVSALAVARQMWDSRAIGSAANALCLLALHGGEVALAEEWANEAIPHLLSAGDAFELSVGFANLGEVALARGDLARAEGAFLDALAQARSSDVSWLFANVLVGFAALAAARSDHTTAAQLLGATEKARSESLHLKVPSFVLHSATTLLVRAALGETDFLDAWEVGRVLTEDEVLECIRTAGSRVQDAHTRFTGDA